MKALILSLLILPIIVVGAYANDDAKPMAERFEIGDIVPSNITLKNQAGENVLLNSLAGEEGTVLVFHRSAKWCPYCQAQLINLKAYQEDIETTGYNIVAISYDSVEDLEEFATKRKMTFPLLSDEGSETIKLFGIFNIEHKEGSFAYGVPYPAIYVVNKDGSIKGILREDGYKKRPEVSDIIEVIKK